MTYYIVKGHIFTIFLSMAHLTSVNLPSKVQDYVGGQIGDFKVYELNGGKSLVFEPKSKGFNRNFISFLKSGRYHFNLAYDEKRSNKDVTIKDAEKCTLYTLLKETSVYQLFECPKSLFFVNKKKNPVQVNGITVKRQAYVSKGPPLYLDGELLYYRGEFL